MEKELKHDSLLFSYSLVKMIGIDYEYFISSNKPEEILFAILSDFKQKKPEQVIKEIVKSTDWCN